MSSFKKAGSSSQPCLQHWLKLSALVLVGVAAVSAHLAAGQTSANVPALDLVTIDRDHRHFVHSATGARFTPWGFNYDRDRSGRLLEYYWKDEWETVVADFREMRQLGANVVRIHLQTSRFLNSPTNLNAESLQMLSKLLHMAETNGLYLDVTGLGCYDRADVPRWFNDMSESNRWNAQALFWQGVARTCAGKSVVFCYDLVNEPVLNDDPKGHDWTPGEFAGRFFLQRLTLDLDGRQPAAVAKQWIEKMVRVIRAEDSRHLITVGAVPWNLSFPGAKPDVYSPEVSESLDFVSVHFYPHQGKVKEALTALKEYEIGKPIVIEELYPLNCSITDMDTFMDGSKKVATGWLSFYWGETIPEYRISKSTAGDAIMLKWLEYFSKKHASMDTR